jgi:hypothetical protein
MCKYTFRLEVPLELSSYEELSERFDSLPAGVVGSFVSPEECSVFSDLEGSEVRRRLARLFDEFIDRRNVRLVE